MKKIQILILLVIIFELISSIALSNVSINVKVNNEIISNYDIYKITIFKDIKFKFK